MVIARWEGALDLQRARRILAGEAPTCADMPDPVRHGVSTDAMRIAERPLLRPEGEEHVPAHAVSEI